MIWDKQSLAHTSSLLVRIVSVAQRQGGFPIEQWKDEEEQAVGRVGSACLPVNGLSGSRVNFDVSSGSLGCPHRVEAVPCKRVSGLDKNRKWP